MRSAEMPCPLSCWAMRARKSALSRSASCSDRFSVVTLSVTMARLAGMRTSDSPVSKAVFGTLPMNWASSVDVPLISGSAHALQQNDKTPTIASLDIEFLIGSKGCQDFIPCRECFTMQRDFEVELIN